LSNPPETINLAGIAEPGIGPVTGCGRAAMMRLRRSETEPIFQLPIRRWIGPGAAIWKALLGTDDGRLEVVAG
jgi:hypothetical protein